MKFLLPLNWTLWAFLLILMLCAWVKISLEKNNSPEAGPALGVFLVWVGLVFLMVVAGLLRWAARKPSVFGSIVALLLLLWPMVPLLGRPVRLAIKQWNHEREKARLNAAT